MTESTDRKTLEGVPDAHRSVLSDLHTQFVACEHDLWDGEDFNGAPSRSEFARSIRFKDPDELTNGELDCMMFSALTTMGGVATLKFVLPRFFAAYFADPTGCGWVVHPEVVMEKLQMAEVDAWPTAERIAALHALIAFDQVERKMAAEEAAASGSDPVYPEEIDVTAWARAVLLDERSLDGVPDPTAS